MQSPSLFLKNLHQDAVIWKSEKIWNDIKNIDEQSEATEKIVQMLAAISNPMKRDSYMQRVSEHISGKWKEYDDKIKMLNVELTGISKSVTKYFVKSTWTDEEVGEKKRLDDQLTFVEQQIGELKKEQRPKLALPLLKTYLKDAERDLAAEREKAQERLADTGNLSKEDMNLPSFFKGDALEAYKFGVFEHGSKYFSRDSKGFWQQVSNFTMRILYHVNSENEEAYRVVVIKNVYNQERTVTVNTDDLVSVQSFKKVVARQGDFVFKGADPDLVKIMEMLQKDEVSSQILDMLGWYKKTNFYVWSNGLSVVQNSESKFVPTDEYGIVNYMSKNYFIPAHSKMYENKDHLYQNEKKFYHFKSSISFSEWTDKMTMVYGVNGLFGALWSISCIFRDFIYSNNNIQASPMLFLYGPKASGKSAMAKSLLALYGIPQSTINLGSVSGAKAFSRKFAQIYNSVVWLNEYKNNVDKRLIESLKSIYDGDPVYSRAKRTNDFQTDDVPTNSTALLSGQEMPTIEPALFSRTILLQFDAAEMRTVEEQRNFADLKNIEASGISSIVTEVLAYRDVLVKRWAMKYRDNFKELVNATSSQNMDDRFILNYCIMLTCFDCLKDKLNLEFDRPKLFSLIKESLVQQFEIMEGNDDVAKFWQVVETLASLGQIRAGQHFRMNTMIGKGNEIFVKVQDIYGLYVKELRQRNDPNYLGKSSLDSYLRQDSECYLGTEKKRMKGSSSYWVTVFDYAMLKEKYQIELFGHDALDVIGDLDAPVIEA